MLNDCLKNIFLELVGKLLNIGQFADSPVEELGGVSLVDDTVVKRDTERHHSVIANPAHANDSDFGWIDDVVETIDTDHA